MTDLDDAIQFDLDMVGLYAARAELAATTTLFAAPALPDINQQCADLELWSTVLTMTYSDAKHLLYTWPEDRAAQLLEDWKSGA